MVGERCQAPENEGPRDEVARRLLCDVRFCLGDKVHW